MNNYGFSLYEHLTPTNKNLKISFQPEKKTTNYKYRIFRDGEVNNFIDVKGDLETTINLSSSGNYRIQVITYDQKNNSKVIDSGLYKIDKEAPIIEIEEYQLEMTVGSELLVMEGVKARDKFEGNITNKIKHNYEELDFTELGRKELIYTVSDEAGNFASKTIYIDVIKDNSMEIIAMQIFILTAILSVIYSMFRYNRAVKLEKRIHKFTIEPLSETNLSLSDKIFKKYKRVIKLFNRILKKSSLIKKISKRYDKYIKVVNDEYTNSIDFVSEKFVITIFLLLIAIVFKATRNEMLNFYEILVPFFLGFILTEIMYAYKFKNYRMQIENDILQAITIMNNAFKSGRSIIQAIDLVTEELDGPVSAEFRKMYVEINFGLAVDVVFARFAERIKLEEVTYMTVSLSILNRTGGNIIKVFSSIEKTLFNKKKLKLELKALTSSSKIIIMVLIFLPIFFSVVLYLLNPLYFIPFINNPIGNMFFILMLFIYISYVYIVRKIIKVRM